MPYEGEAPLQRTGAQGRWRDSGPAFLFPPPPEAPLSAATGKRRGWHRARRAQGAQGTGWVGTGRRVRRAYSSALRGREAGGPGGHGGAGRAAGHGRERLGEVGRGRLGCGGRPGGAGWCRPARFLFRARSHRKAQGSSGSSLQTRKLGPGALPPLPTHSPLPRGHRARPRVSSCARRVPANALCKGPTRTRRGCAVAMPLFGGLWSEQGVRGQKTRRPLTFVGLGRAAASSCEALAFLIGFLEREFILPG